MTKGEREAILEQRNEAFNMAVRFGWISPHISSHIEQLIRFNIPNLLEALDKIEIERNEWEKCSELNRGDLVEKIGRCEGLEAKIIIMEADRDKWKARVEALEKALKESYSSCQSCKFKNNKDNNCKNCNNDNNNWQLDEVRFAGNN